MTLKTTLIYAVLIFHIAFYLHVLNVALGSYNNLSNPQFCFLSQFRRGDLTFGKTSDDPQGKTSQPCSRAMT